MRLDLVDGIRGHLLVGMLIAHLSLSGAVPALGYFHHHLVIRMYDAEFFVPISGFIIGYLYVEKLKTAPNFYGFLNGRLLTIYKYYLLSAAPFLATAILTGSSSDVAGLLFNIAIMQEGGRYSDILPIYFYCFLLLYALFWMVPRIGFTVPLLASGGIFLASQATYETGMFGLSGSFVVFDIAAWQFLFMLFLFIGANWQAAMSLMQGLSDKAYLTLVALLTVALVIGRQVHFYPTPFEGFEALNINWSRLHLHPIFLLKILIVITLFCAILTRPTGVLVIPNKAIRWYFSLPFLRNIGKYSIQMFTLHVFMMALFYEAKPALTAPALYLLAVGLVVIFIAVPNIWMAAKQRQRNLATAPA